MAFQWYTSPIASDMTKQPMFDLVPFASARRIVTYFDRHAGFVGQSLQFIFPKSISMAVAPNAVCCHQKSLRFRVPLLAQLLPPATNRFHGKFTGVVTDANRHPCFVGFNIVNAVGNRFTKFLVRKVVRVDLQRFSFWAVLLASICLFPRISFFLVSTDTAGRFPRWQARTRRAMCSNCALRSGWSVPYRVLRLPCREFPSERRTLEIFIRLTVYP